MTVIAVLIGLILSDFELGHSRRCLYTKTRQDTTTTDVERSISCTTFVLVFHHYIMATYFISVHTLLQRLDAEQTVGEEHDCHSDACLEDVKFDVQRATRLKMIERKALVVRSTSCPAAANAIRSAQRVDR
jgi:hydroxyacyl-ACP dehydratase HTD2-like protein with hotdog domain